MIQIKTFVFNPIQVNTFVLYDESKECVIIDAGCYSSEEKKELGTFIKNNRLTPVKLLNTHGHIDHVLGNRYVSDCYNLFPQFHQDDLALMSHVKDYGTLFGIDVEPLPSPGSFLSEHEKICFGHSQLDVIHVPGHSPGSIVFYHEAGKLLIAGDVLFNGSIGRTDLPGGNYNLLVSGIKTKLLTLEKDVVVYPGHGQETTIGKETETNYFLITDQ